MDIDFLVQSMNIADELDDEVLQKIGRAVVDGYNEDDMSRDEWRKRYDGALKLAAQVVEAKSTPWQNASNVKYPLLTTASVQFSARAYPALVPGTDVVRCRTTGEDPDGLKADRAYRIGKHMSYQILDEMEEWEEDMDRLLIMVPITGTEFKKTYFDAALGRNVSRHVLARDLVVNYWAKSLEQAQRKTEVIELSKNEVRERQLKGIFRDIDFGQADSPKDTIKDQVQGTSPPQSSDTNPYRFLECHCFWDLDGDGYEEPYVITVHETSAKVARIVARFDADGVDSILDVDDEGNTKTKVLGIRPVEYYTKFSFIPSLDGGFYDIGFGHLLGPINEAVNTTINQLVDSGTLAVMQSGFLARGIKIRGGNSSFKQGEWKFVDSTMDDLRKGIFPLQFKEPSQTLFQLLGMLIESGEKLASVTDLLLGENPGQNQPATTTMAVIEQGLKVFTAIYKRQYRSLKSEYRKLYRLNRLYLKNESYFRVIDPGQETMAKIGNGDYQGDPTDIQPFADPNIVSETQRLTKAQALVEALQNGSPADPLETWRRYYEAMQVPAIDKLLPKEMPPPPVDPKIEVDMQRLAMEDKHKSIAHQFEQARIAIEQERNALTAQQNELKSQIDKFRADTELFRAKIDEFVAVSNSENSDKEISGVEDNDDAVKLEIARMTEQTKRDIASMNAESNERIARFNAQVQVLMKKHEQKPTDEAKEDNKDESVKDLAKSIEELVTQMSKPKRIVTDEEGNPVGIEAV